MPNRYGHDNLLCDMKKDTRRQFLESRFDGIGGSDAPIIMGNSLHRTIGELWKEKVERIIDDRSNEFILKKGHSIEAWARPQVEMDTGKTFRPANCVSPTCSFLKVSLDGWNPETKEIWECKHLAAPAVDYLQNGNWETVPIQYRDQLMHAALVTGASVIYFTGVKRKKINGKWQKAIKTIRVEIGQEQADYISKKLIPAELEFWWRVENKIPPDAKVNYKNNKTNVP